MHLAKLSDRQFHAVTSQLPPSRLFLVCIAPLVCAVSATSGIAPTVAFVAGSDHQKGVFD